MKGTVAYDNFLSSQPEICGIYVNSIMDEGTIVLKKKAPPPYKIESQYIIIWHL